MVKIRNKEESYKRRVSVVLIVTVILLVILLGLLFYESRTSSPQLSAYSEDWNDISQFKEELEDHPSGLYSIKPIISSPALLDEIEDPTDKVYVAIGVEKIYLDNEARAIWKFVERGGKVLIADDFGFANSVSTQFGVEFLQGRLWDEYFEKNPKFVVSAVNDVPFEFSGAVMFNEPSALKVSNGKSWVKSSEHAWLDVNFNGQRDIKKEDSGNVVMEGFQEYDMVASVDKSEGKAVFISDSGLFINDMIDRKSNRDFALAVMEYLLPQGGEVLIDEGRHDDQNVVTNLQQESFHIIVVSTTNNNFKLLTGVIVFLGMIILLVALSDPPDLVHKQRVFLPNLDELVSPILISQDQERVRRILTEKIRLTQGYSVDEFRALSLSEMEDIIENDDLMDFIVDTKRRYSSEELKEILSEIQEWGTDVE